MFKQADVGTGTGQASGCRHKPRTIVTADPELDDLNSMIRLLLYSNEIQIEGLIYASSRFHWKGDGKGTVFFLPSREYDEPRESFRWAPGERFIDDALDAYAQVYSNLLVHDPEYPAPEHLRSLVCHGNVAFEGDMAEPTPGSRLIEAALLEENPEPVHLQAWAGTSTIARALKSIEERFSGWADWEQRKAAVCQRTILTKFASQDATFEEYISSSWPDIPVIDVAASAWGYFARRVILPADAPMLTADWLQSNVRAMGPLGALYRVWGDGRQMVEGDYTDFFHLCGYSAEDLRTRGYRVWTDPQPAGEWISEGDTPNMLNLFANGLRGFEHPSFGGWGGRSVPASDGQWLVRSAVDRARDGDAPEEYALTRWFGDAQRDFAARLAWSVRSTYQSANHPPVVSVAPAEDLTVHPGSTVTLTASAADPDGDSLTYAWWHYREAGTYSGELEFDEVHEPVLTARVPWGAVAGDTIHLILEVRDDGEPPLVSYARVILTLGTAVAR
ncbi:DUF1593 domain-containing protein [Ruania rhizosphaerae]|uniref:DUF1593 domain-containing protein n=1 Tax=Ruania rhizosphaerae TaxID=1840413 RepID=UPI001357489F|nr:DUF1593 domain-containing protein [Ruania rhizosphaerae]